MHHFSEVNNKAVLWGLLAVFLGYTSLANAQTVPESAKVYSATHSDINLFGFSVAAYENRILVGALKQDHQANGADTGAALCFRLLYPLGEGKDMTDPMQRMVNLIKASGHSNLYSDIDPNGEHNEGFWARRFEDAILWLYEVN